jgi:hypothetical protein
MARHPVKVGWVLSQGERVNPRYNKIYRFFDSRIMKDIITGLNGRQYQRHDLGNDWQRAFNLGKA